MVVGGRELIDTLWNVNLWDISERIQKLRINRYIMECKFMLVVLAYLIDYELIDTLWNVN